jgi:hypothetical protein
MLFCVNVIFTHWGKEIDPSVVPNSQLNFMPLPTWAEVRKIYIDRAHFEFSTALAEDLGLPGSYGV